METILSIAGKPGLYKLVSRGNRNLIVETIDEVPLWEVLDSVSKKEEGKPSAFNYKKAPAAELHDYFAEVLPNYDRDRVHDSDIKKLLQWYNILAKYGITDFKATLAPTEGENVDDRAEQVAE